MKSNKFLTRLLSAALASAMMAMPTLIHSMDLKRSVLTALAKRAETSIAGSQVRQQQFVVEGAEGAFLPELNVRAKVGPEYTNQGGTDDSHVYAQLSAILSQHIYDGGARSARLQSAQLGLLSTQYQSRAVLESIALDVIEVYLSVVFQQEIVRMHSENIREYQKIQEITEARLNSGAATEADVMAVRARVIGSRAALNAARLQLSEAQYAYNRLVGPIENDMVIPTLVNDVFLDNFELLLEKMRTQNVALLQNKYDRRISMADLSATEAGRMPVVSGTVESEYSDQFGGEQENTDSTRLGAYINVNYKYGFGGVLGSNIARQEERVQELSMLRELLLRDNEIELQGKFSEYQSLKKVLNSIQSELQANRSVLDAQREQQKIGDVKLLDVLNSQERVNGAQIRFLQTQQKDHFVRYEIMFTIGELLAYFR